MEATLPTGAVLLTRGLGAGPPATTRPLRESVARRRSRDSGRVLHVALVRGFPGRAADARPRRTGALEPNAGRLCRRQWLHARPARAVREALLLRAGGAGAAGHAVAGPASARPSHRRPRRVDRCPAHGAASPAFAGPTAVARDR